jgi:hypothetical protein
VKRHYFSTYPLSPLLQPSGNSGMRPLLKLKAKWTDQVKDHLDGFHCQAKRETNWLLTTCCFSRRISVESEKSLWFMFLWWDERAYFKWAGRDRSGTHWSRRFILRVNIAVPRDLPFQLTKKASPCSSFLQNCSRILLVIWGHDLLYKNLAVNT